MVHCPISKPIAKLFAEANAFKELSSQLLKDPECNSLFCLKSTTLHMFVWFSTNWMTNQKVKNNILFPLLSLNSFHIPDQIEIGKCFTLSGICWMEQVFQQKPATNEFNCLLSKPSPPTLYIEFFFELLVSLLNQYLVLNLMSECRK